MPSTLTLARDFSGSHAVIVATRPLINHIGPRLMQTPITLRALPQHSVCSLDIHPDFPFMSPHFEFRSANIRTALPILKHSAVSAHFQSSLAIVTNRRTLKDRQLLAEFVDLLGDSNSGKFQHLDSLLLSVSLQRGLNAHAGHVAAGITIDLPRHLPSLRRLLVRCSARVSFRPQQVASFYPGLTHLELYLGNRNETSARNSAHLTAVTKTLQNLRVLRLFGLSSLGHEDPGTALCFLDFLSPRVEQLGLFDMDRSCILLRRSSGGANPIASALVRCATDGGSLRELEIDSTFPLTQFLNETADAVAALLAASGRDALQIQSLKICRRNRHYLSSLRFLRAFPHLLQLHIRPDQMVPNHEFELLHEVTASIQHLDLSVCSQTRIPPGILPKCVNLRTLNLRSSWRDGALLTDVSNMPSLIALDISDRAGWFACEHFGAWTPPRELRVLDCIVPKAASVADYAFLTRIRSGQLQYARFQVCPFEDKLLELCGPNARVEFVDKFL